MLSRLKSFFDEHLSTDTPQGRRDPEHVLRLATAALLLEMVRMDHQVAPEEQAAVEAAVRDHFGLERQAAVELLALAEAERSQSADYYQFTSLINRSYTQEQKARLIELLWRVAYADESLHKYEEHLVRKVAELLYVPHSVFIAAKLRAQGEG